MLQHVMQKTLPVLLHPLLLSAQLMVVGCWWGAELRAESPRTDASEPTPFTAISAIPGLPLSTLPLAATPAADQTQIAAQFVSQMLQELLYESGKTEFEEMPGWGDTKRITSGYKIRTNDWKVRVDKRRKEVNDGLWRHYKVWIDQPEKNTVVQMVNLHSLPDGQIAFQVRAFAPLNAFARHSQWERGIQLYSISAKAKAYVEICISCQTGLKIVPDQHFLAMEFTPLVTGTTITLHEFELERVSKLGGTPVDLLGDALRSTIGKQLTKQGDKITGSLNRSIAKRQDRMKLSLSSLLPHQTTAP